MAVAVDDVADRNLEPLCQLLFQPGGERGVDRVAEDDALGRDEKDRRPGAVARPVEITRHVGDVPRRTARSLRGGNRGTHYGHEHQRAYPLCHRISVGGFYSF